MGTVTQGWKSDLLGLTDVVGDHFCLPVRLGRGDELSRKSETRRDRVQKIKQVMDGMD